MLVAAGYQAIGLDHFARPDGPDGRSPADGTLRRNFQGYTTDAAPVLLGMGASSIGGIEAGAAMPRTSRTSAAGWRRSRPARCRSAAAAPSPPRTALRRHCIERVMCDFALDLAALPPALVAEVRPALAPLEADGLLDLTPDLLRVTAAGRRHVRHVAACFDAYLGTGTGRHSAAV